MQITRRINQFIKEAAILAVNGEADATLEECITEYTNQILEDDFYCVVNWANWKGISIPAKLRSVIDPEF